MKTTKNNLENSDVLFICDDDFALETAIYLELSSEEFKNKDKVIVKDAAAKDPINEYFWEENDIFDH